MKLRNKKTGELVEVFNIGLVWNKYGMPADIEQYKNLAELNDEWEDDKDKDDLSNQPLIKDEKIRKAVRVWAYINRVDAIVYAERDDRSLCTLIDYGIEDTSISFVGWIPTLKDGKDYTIAELCGEEKE